MKTEFTPKEKEVIKIAVKEYQGDIDLSLKTANGYKPSDREVLIEGAIVCDDILKKLS